MPKQAKKATTTTKKAPKAIAKKKTAAPAAKTNVKAKAAKKTSSGNYLDLCLILDCTGSMYSWIARAKSTLSEIIDSVKKENPSLIARVCFIGYRDV